MFRKRILLASLLKPVSDTRLYEKIGLSLAKLPQTEVHIAGFQSKLPEPPAGTSLFFHPVFHFQRLSLGRLTAQLRYWKLLQKIKPDLLVVGTHELLAASVLFCRLYSCRLVYDVQENYFLNLTTQNVYPRLVGKLLGHVVRGLENLLARNVDHFFLAEESYARELPFLGQRYTVLPNKYLPPVSFAPAPKAYPITLAEAQPLRLLYSGTISRLYGVLEAIDFTKQLRAWVPEAELTIIGYCAEAAFLEELRSYCAGLPFVTLIGGDKLVPHEEILTQEQSHYLGLLPYHPHPSTFNCIPTKLYEYIGNGLVVIAEQNELWARILEDTQAGFCIRFQQESSAANVEVLLRRTYYHRGIPEEVGWRQEEQNVQTVAQQLLSLDIS